MTSPAKTRALAPALALVLALAACTGPGLRTSSPASDEASEAVDTWYSHEAATARLDEVLAELGPELELTRWWRDEPRCLPSWATGCDPDERSADAAPPAQVSPPPAALLAAYADYLATAEPETLHAAHLVDYAELLMVDGRFERAAELLDPLVGGGEDETGPGSDRGVRARAARLLVEAERELWLDAQPYLVDARIARATALRETLAEIRADSSIWNHDGVDASAIRSASEELLGALAWDIGISAQQAGFAGDPAMFAVCVTALTELFGASEGLGRAKLEVVINEAANCAYADYQVGNAIALKQALALRYPDSPLAPDALLWIADTRREVLMFAQALDAYRKFWVLYPEDERAVVARTRWVELAITLSRPVADTVADWREGSPDERVLAAAIEFRAAQQQPGTEDLVAYLDEYGEEGGRARVLAVWASQASAAMRRSCPDPTRASGLCTTRALDGRLGEVLTRKRGDRREAERALDRAQKLLASEDWREDPIAAAGAPLALEAKELRELEATVALLVGDLSAEEALGVQPPKTYEPTRTRLWLDERKLSVAAMISAYERVGRNDQARVAAAAERTAQVYESDATVLARVEAELRARGELELADELAALADTRLSQALDAYHGCTSAIASYGDDPAGLLGPCKLGVGRLTGLHEPVRPLLDQPSLGVLALGTN